MSKTTTVRAFVEVEDGVFVSTRAIRVLNAETRTITLENGMSARLKNARETREARKFLDGRSGEPDTAKH